MSSTALNFSSSEAEFTNDESNISCATKFWNLLSNESPILRYKVFNICCIVGVQIVFYT